MVATNKDVYNVTCKQCGVTYQILANREDVSKWMQGDSYIQDVLYYLTSSEREMFISQTCDNCWKNMFGEEEDMFGDEE